MEKWIETVYTMNSIGQTKFYLYVCFWNVLLILCQGQTVIPVRDGLSGLFLLCFFLFMYLYLFYPWFGLLCLCWLKLFELISVCAFAFMLYFTFSAIVILSSFSNLKYQEFQPTLKSFL